MEGGRSLICNGNNNDCSQRTNHQALFPCLTRKVLQEFKFELVAMQNIKQGLVSKDVKELMPVEPDLDM